MTDLSVSDLTLKAGASTLVSNATFNLSPGEFVVLLGPNGAGKTSLIRSALGLEVPTSGTSMLNKTPVDLLTPSDRARLIAYLPQSRPLAWPNKVRDIVALGRYSYGATIGRLRGDDREAVEQAIDDCDLGELAERRADTLSGGELARMHCARAFATNAKLFVADEPIAALDPFHQFKILGLVSDFVSKGGGALVVLHDLQLASRYASRLIWLKNGRIVADGSPEDTLSEERILEVYGVHSRVEGTTVMLDPPE